MMLQVLPENTPTMVHRLIILSGIFSSIVHGTSSTAGKKMVKRQVANVPIPPQNPPVFSALDQLRGNEALSATQVQQVLSAAYPGQSYPTYSYIPQTSFSCNQVRQFGYYADPETRCQVFRRCEANNFMFSYICPNGTVFNQITLVCDWFFNVNCPSAGGFFDYSNPRIYRQDLRLFDDYYGNGLGYGVGGAVGGASYGAGSGYGQGMLYEAASNVVSAMTSSGTSSSSGSSVSSAQSSNSGSAQLNSAFPGQQQSQNNGNSQYRRMGSGMSKDSDTIII